MSNIAFTRFGVDLCRSEHMQKAFLQLGRNEVLVLAAIAACSSQEHGTVGLECSEEELTEFVNSHERELWRLVKGFDIQIETVQ